jgi:hypothetical protein
VPDNPKIIHFPGASSKVVGNSSPDPVSKLNIGPVSFHCTSCGEICQADFKKMIFRSVDFYCSGCGNFFKITNPAFTIEPKIKK